MRTAKSTAAAFTAEKISETTLSTAKTNNVVEVEFRDPVVTSFAEASTPKSEVALRVAENARAYQSKLASRDKDKKAGPIRTIATETGNLFQLNPYLIKIKEGWNSRDANSPENLKHIDELAFSISRIGVKNPLSIIVEDDVPYLTDGHCRLLATFRAIEVYGASIMSIPVIIEKKVNDEAARIVMQLVRNGGKRLTVTEQGTVFMKLVNFGWNFEMIAENAGMQPGRVKEIVSLMEEISPETVKMVNSGLFKANIAEQTLKQVGGDGKVADKVLSEAVSIAKAEGKKRVLQQHVHKAMGNMKIGARPGGNGPRVDLKGMLKAALKSEGSAIDTSDPDVVTLTISSGEWDRLKAAIGM